MQNFHAIGISINHVQKLHFWFAVYSFAHSIHHITSHQMDNASYFFQPFSLNHSGFYLSQVKWLRWQCTRCRCRSNWIQWICALMKILWMLISCLALRTKPFILWCNCDANTFEMEPFDGTILGIACDHFVACFVWPLTIAVSLNAAVVTGATIEHCGLLLHWCWIGDWSWKHSSGHCRRRRWKRWRRGRQRWWVWFPPKW